MQRLLDFVSHTRYKLALRARVLIDLVLVAVGLMLIAMGGTSTLELTGAAATLIGALLLFSNLWKAWTFDQQTLIVENEEFFDLIQGCRLPEGFQLELGALALPTDLRGISASLARPYITSNEVNRGLDAGRNPIVVEPTRYDVPAVLQSYRSRCIHLRRPKRNDPKIGLRSDRSGGSVGNRDTITLQKTDYFKGAATNEMATEQFESVTDARRGRPSLLYAVSDLVVSRNELLGLDESTLSNHIGVSTVVLTADNQLVIQHQGEQTISANEAAVGASGSLDLTDIERTAISDPTLQGLLRYGMEREAEEELSATFDNGRKNTVLTGFARYLARGGKPEFFGITRTSSSLADLRPSRADLRYVSGIRGRPFKPDAAGLILVLEDLLKEGESNHRRYGLSMVVSLRMARDYLTLNELEF